MNVCIVSGSNGLIGSECVEFFSDHFDLIVGIDNDLRSYFFGKEASTSWNINRYPNYKHYNLDIRDQTQLQNIFSEYNSDIKLVVHTAAQPSHDWAAKEPFTDFTVNANGTLNMLEFTRKYSEKSVFVFTSTNKVYGEHPNQLPLVEMDTRWEIDSNHPFEQGIDESMNVDQTKHSLFGASKVAADIICQEYGRYFNMNVGIFRCGCLTGSKHSGVMLHGFLSYLMKCAITGNQYTIFGYKGKQVRDNIHSSDLVNMFWHFYHNPKHGEVYNVGGSRFSNCSIIEAISICETISGNKVNSQYSKENRNGDHIWYISDMLKFRSQYPDWKFNYDLESILLQIYQNQH